MISAGSLPLPQTELTTSVLTPDAFPKRQSPPNTSVLFVLHHPSAHRTGDPHGHQPVSPTLMVERSAQAVSRQEKSLKSSRISNILHTKASPKAGKAAAGEGCNPAPTSPLVHPSTLAQGGRQQTAPAPAPSAYSMAHTWRVTRRNGAWYHPRHLPACQACSLQQAVKHRELLNQSIWILFYSLCPVAVDATSAGTGWAVLLYTRTDPGYKGEDTSADSSVPILDDCEKAAKQEDFRDSVSVLLLPVSPASAKHACLLSREESLDMLQSVSLLYEM